MTMKETSAILRRPEKIRRQTRLRRSVRILENRSEKQTVVLGLTNNG